MRIRFLAGSTIDTHESSFRKGQEEPEAASHRVEADIVIGERLRISFHETYSAEANLCFPNHRLRKVDGVHQCPARRRFARQMARPRTHVQKPLACQVTKGCKDWFEGLARER